jgi:hypothetical protein
MFYTSICFNYNEYDFPSVESMLIWGKENTTKLGKGSEIKYIDHYIGVLIMVFKRNRTIK